MRLFAITTQCLAAALILCLAAGARADLVADFQLNDLYTSSDAAENWTTTNLTPGAGFSASFNNSGNPAKSIETDGFESANTEATSRSDNKSYTFTVTPDAGKALLFQSASWDSQALASGTGPMQTSTSLFWSVDSFTSNVGGSFQVAAAENTTSAWTANSVSLAGADVQFGPTTFELAVWDNSTSGNKKNRIDNVQIHAAVATIHTLTTPTADAIRGEGQTNAPTGYYVDANRNVIGIQGSTGAAERQNENVVLGFTLPTLADPSIYSATLSLNKLGERFDNVHFNLDLYGLSTTNPDGSGTSFFYEGANDPSASVSLLADDFITDAQSNGSTSIADVTAFIASLYNGQNPLQTEVFFRLNPDQNLSLSQIDRLIVDLASAQLVILSIPTPAALPAGMMLMGVVVMRRRRM